MQEQYIFIHDAILEAVTCGDTQISASNLRRSIQKLSHRHPETNFTGFESQFKAYIIQLSAVTITMLHCIIDLYRVLICTYMYICMHVYACIPTTHTHMHKYTLTHLYDLCCISLQVLKKVSPSPRERLCKKALENPTRNRTNDYLPGNKFNQYK